MIFRTHVRDCLYLNWALPAEKLPAPPDPLRYDLRKQDGREVVFASALFFRQDGLQFSSILLPRVDAPQCQVHLCTLDGDGVPSVLIRAVFVPSWFAPGARWVTRQPACAARLVYPASTATLDTWRWEVHRGSRLVVEAEIGAPVTAPGSDLGSWDQTVSFFRRRGLGFTETLRGLRRLEIETSNAEVTPIRATVADDGLLRKQLPEVGSSALLEIHSAWLCAPMRISYVLSGAERAAVGSSVPAPG
jgi:hypothetical protein